MGMKLVVDWEWCEEMFSTIDVLHQAIMSLGVGVEYRQVPNAFQMGFMKDGVVVGVIESHEVVSGSRYSPEVEDQIQLYLDEDFLRIHGRSLLTRAIPIYAEWDFSLSDPDEKFPTDHTDLIRRKYLKSAYKALSQLLDRPA